MYKFLLCLCIGWLLFAHSGQAQTNLLQQKVSVNKTAVTIQEVLNYLSSSYKINFSYSKDLVSLQQKVTVKANELTLREVLNNLFKGKDILYIVIGDQIALQKGRKKKSGFTISGYVTDSASGEALAGALVANGIAQTSSNVYGFYSLPSPTGEFNLEVRYLGYMPLLLNIPSLSQDTSLALQLKRIDRELEEVVIKSDKNTDLQHANKISINSSELNQMPHLMGEADAIKAFQLMPGVQAREGSSDLIVRGGGPDQNLILLDGVPVYNVAHLLGVFSVFNPDAIKKVDMIKGGFPAPYGGRLSSVVDIRLKEGNTQRFSGSGSIGLISSKLLLEGPIKNEKTSFLIAARRTYLDLITAIIGRNNNRYNFYDLNAKVNHTLSSKDRVYLSVYSGLDKFVSTENLPEQRFKMQWGNSTAALRWNHIYGSKLFSNVTLTQSNYNFRQKSDVEDTQLGIKIDRHVNFNSSINDLGAKADFDFAASNKHNLRFGGSYIYHKFNPESATLKTDTVTLTTSSFSKVSAHEGYTYVEDRIRISENLQANAGIHLSGFSVRSKNYTSLQPRLGIAYTFKNGFSLNTSYSTMAQYLHLLSNTSTGSPTDVWAPATDRVKPQRSWQATFGGAVSVMKDRVEIVADLYYKEMRDVAEFRDGANFVDAFLKAGPTTNFTSLIVPSYEERVISGTGLSYGSEWMIRKREGKTSGWIGYTLAWATRKLDGINNNQSYSYTYDSRHSFALVINHKFSKKLSVSSNWTYRSGYVTTLPLSSYKLYIEPVEYNPYYGGYYGRENIDHLSVRNNYRMPSYHRMDLSLTHTKNKKWGERSWSISVYNVYNRQNPYYLEVDSYNGGSNGQRSISQVSLFPILPSFSYSFKF